MCTGTPWAGAAGADSGGQSDEGAKSRAPRAWRSCGGEESASCALGVPGQGCRSQEVESRVPGPRRALRESRVCVCVFARGGDQAGDRSHCAIERPRLRRVREAPVSPRRGPRGWGRVSSEPEGSSASASGRVGAGRRLVTPAPESLSALSQLGRGHIPPAGEALLAKVGPLPQGWGP